MGHADWPKRSLPKVMEHFPTYEFQKCVYALRWQFPESVAFLAWINFFVLASRN